MLFEQLEKAWQETKTEIRSNAQQEERVFNNISNQTFKASENTISAPKQSTVSTYSSGIQWYKYYKYVAIVSFFIAAISLFFYFIKSQEVKNTADQAGLVLRELPKGQKLRFYLPDGSVVWLNAGSKIKYPSTFGEKTRNVELEGEAFFNVVRDTTRKFIIKTGSIETVVLGTSFNVQALPEYNDIRVAVKSGRVLVENVIQNPNQVSVLKDSVVLQPSQMAIFNKAENKLEMTDCNIDDIIGWKDGILVFNDADLSNVINDLERWYGVNFVVDSQIKTNHLFTGDFENNSLEYVLQGICYASDLNFKIDGNTVFLYEKSSNMMKTNTNGNVSE